MKPKRPRKPPRKTSTLLRYLRRSIDVTQKWYSLPGEFRNEVNANINRSRALLSELRSGLNQGSGGAGKGRG